jgi:hypothetical protein
VNFTLLAASFLQARLLSRTRIARRRRSNHLSHADCEQLSTEALASNADSCDNCFRKNLKAV